MISFLVHLNCYKKVFLKTPTTILLKSVHFLLTIYTRNFPYSNRCTQLKKTKEIHNKEKRYYL